MIRSHFSTITFSFLVAFPLSLLPIAKQNLAYWPEWVALVMIYWCTTMPKRYSVGFAWTVGLLLDLLSGTLLGLNALMFTLLSYLLLSVNRFVENKTLLQQSLLVGVTLMPSLLLRLWGGQILNVPAENHQLWSVALLSALVWPWVYATLTALHQRTVYSDRNQIF